MIAVRVEINRAVIKASNRPIEINATAGNAPLEFMPIKSVAIVDRTRLKSTGILILCNQIRLVAVVWVTNKNVAITKDIKNAGICLIIMLFSLFTYSPTHSPTHLLTCLPDKT